MPVPNKFAQIARKRNAPQMRQKLASTPPSRVAVRCPQMADMAKQQGGQQRGKHGGYGLKKFDAAVFKLPRRVVNG